jgi:branched-chain amino acid transport system permease protein
VTLPEIARPLAENRMAIYGLLLVVAIVYMPYGAADTLIAYLKRKRLARSDSAIRAVTP